jgi:FKBP-type peptidyl-prolyl cis-trans isomerase
MAALVLLAAACSSETPSCAPDGITSESGLRLRDLECGRGETVERGDVVAVSYEARLSDGSLIESADRFEVSLGAGQVIAGLEEGIVGMRVGGRRRLVVPPGLAFGERGLADRFPPDATLELVVELVGSTGSS